MNNIDELYNAVIDKINDVKYQRDALDDELDQLKEHLASLTDIIENALDDEDFDTYKNASEEKVRTEFAIAAKKKLLAKKKRPSIEDFCEEWNSFKAEYEKEFKPAYEKYKEARKALYEQYKAVQDLQAKAVYLRKRIGVTCGFPCGEWSNIDLEGNEWTKLGFSSIETKPARGVITKLAPDALFFASVGLLPKELDEESYRISVIKNN